MERNITTKLLEWKTKINRKPLIVRGARQVGKSYSIRHFGKEFFKGNLCEINLEKNPNWHGIFKTNFDVIRIISELELLINKRITPGKDLLFLDEIQSCPEAIMALRYFYEDIPELHVIAAGSLLEFAIQDIPFPVGRIELMNMYPMSFNEFLNAISKHKMANLLHQTPVTLSEVVHNELINELRRYFFVGGMPECVKKFKQSQRFMDVFQIQNDLLNTFRQDFAKYTPKADSRCLNTVLSSIAQQVGSQIKYSKLSESFTNPTLKKAFDLLETARLIQRIRAASPAGLPLAAYASDKKFKAIMLDIGLMMRMSGLSIENEYQKSDLLAIFKGAIAEQFVGQELLAAGVDLYYWSRAAKSSSAETDFLININQQIIPIEVKSGSKGRLRSLHILLDEYKNVQKAFVFSEAKYYNNDQKINFLPLYYVLASLKDFLSM